MHHGKNKLIEAFRKGGKRSFNQVTAAKLFPYHNVVQLNDYQLHVHPALNVLSCCLSMCVVHRQHSGSGGSSAEGH